jgi:histidine triad (HIT) family protein
MAACIFCRIIAGEAPSEQVYSDDLVVAFHDIHPVAPTHVLVVPRKHIASVNELLPEDEILVGRMFSAARQIAWEQGIQDSGYRLVVNTGPHAGQLVYHLHLHVIGGQPMRFRMG